MGPGAPSMMHPAQPMVPPQQYTVRPPAVPQVGVTTAGILYPQKVILYVFVDIFANVCKHITYSIFITVGLHTHTQYLLKHLLYCCFYFDY